MNIIKDSSSKKSNPYPHLKDQEVKEIRGFFKRRKVKAENFLAEVEKSRANPYTVTITCDDGRLMDFARITTIIRVVVDGVKCEVLPLSDGRIVGGYGFYWIPTLPRFMAGMVGVVRKKYFPDSYIETTSLEICPYMDEIVKSSPISPWAFDMLTKYMSAIGDQFQGTLKFETFIRDEVIDRLEAKCAELSQPDFLIASLLKSDNDVFDLPLRSLLGDEQYEGGGRIIHMVEDYVRGIDLLHAPQPEKWGISLKDILVSQLVGDALEGK